ncbi:MAG TPA: hypothetical protein PKX87_06785 [Alphaproteobacteria bacterium]|nr:hypothetical protein [Alphaproteobacteria bacterium]
MAYQSLCGRFSSNATGAVALSTSVGSMLALDYAFYSPNLAMTLTSVGFGMGWGMMGWISGAIRESHVKDSLYAQRVGVRRGSRILQRAEVAAYGLTLAFGVAAKAFINEGIEAANIQKAQNQTPKTLSVPGPSQPNSLAPNPLP